MVVAAAARGGGDGARGGVRVLRPTPRVKLLQWSSSVETRTHPVLVLVTAFWGAVPRPDTVVVLVRRTVLSGPTSMVV